MREGINMDGAKRMCAVVARRCREWLPSQTRRSAGNIALTMAVILTSLMGLAGAGVDYGLIVIETARLQHALDAASLAGARALVTSTASAQADRDTAGQTAAAAYLALQGYTDGVNGFRVSYVPSSSDTTTGASHDTLQVNGTVLKPTSFWKVIGITSTTINRTSTAVASGGMVDVMLSLDLTKSMELSGTDDIGNLQDAVIAFINQMQLSTTDPRGSQVGIARWAGTVCSWSKVNMPTPVPTSTRTPSRTPTPIPTPTGANWNTTIDWNTGAPSSNTGEYTTPCYGDSTMLSYLSQDKTTLTKIINGGTGCPTRPAAPSTPAPYSPGSMSQYACPIAPYDFPVTGIMWNGDSQTRATGMTGHTWSQVTGTNLANSIKIVNGSMTGCYAWATSTTNCQTNGRNDAATTGLARKVLVIITDGFSQISPTDPLPAAYPTYTSTAGTRYADPAAGWNAEVVDLATRLKKGPDNDASTLDDNVEIYVVGFFPVPYSTSTSITNWARSKAAATGSVSAGTHPCPSSTLPSSSTFSYTASSVDPGVDELLNKVSSSKAGSCDHYFPISKSEGASLPQLFRVMAGSIARGKLQ
jgi:Flp pilus assembly protein TadG